MTTQPTLNNAGKQWASGNTIQENPITVDERDDWKYEVANDDTRLGLDEWVRVRRDLIAAEKYADKPYWEQWRDAVDEASRLKTRQNDMRLVIVWAIIVVLLGGIASLLASVGL